MTNNDYFNTGRRHGSYLVTPPEVHRQSAKALNKQNYDNLTLDSGKHFLDLKGYHG